MRFKKINIYCLTRDISYWKRLLNFLFFLYLVLKITTTWSAFLWFSYFGHQFYLPLLCIIKPNFDVEMKANNTNDISVSLWSSVGFIDTCQSRYLRIITLFFSSPSPMTCLILVSQPVLYQALNTVYSKGLPSSIISQSSYKMLNLVSN